MGAHPTLRNSCDRYHTCHKEFDFVLSHSSRRYADCCLFSFVPVHPRWVRLSVLSHMEGGQEMNEIDSWSPAHIDVKQKY